MGEKPAKSRRDFLKLAATGAPVAAAAAIAGGAVQARDAEDAGTHSESYRETEHVRKYLESARF